MDPKDIVAQGYDRIADTYAEWAPNVRVDERARYTSRIVGSLPEGSSLLELGCGNGLPTTKLLASRYHVTGVDISTRQIELARENVPGARFIQADMTTLDFPPASFDGIAAFYALTHVPREQQEALFRSMASWLRPGGLLVASMGAESSEGDVADDWLGAPMYFSHYDAATSQALVERSGMVVESAQVEVAEEDGADIPFLWVVARKPN